MQIKLFKSDKKLNKFLLKSILKEIKQNNNLSLGIGFEKEMIPFFEIISDSKKINWKSVKIISLIEYFSDQSTMFYSLLQNEFISKLNDFPHENFFTKVDEIKSLKDSHNLNKLYNEKINLAIFYLDFRGNFLSNDYESKCNFIHISTNGDKVISPGIKSILSFDKIIIISNNPNSEKVLNKLVSKEIDENDPFTLLNFHKNSILLSLSSLVSKKNIIESVNKHDLEKWNRKLFKEVSDLESEIDINKTIGDKYINDNIEEISKVSDNSLDNELEDALKIINEEKYENFEENILENKENANENVEIDSENLITDIIDDSLIANLDSSFSKKNFDEELYGSHFVEKNLFSENDSFNYENNTVPNESHDKEISFNNENFLDKKTSYLEENNKETILNNYSSNDSPFNNQKKFEEDKKTYKNFPNSNFKKDIINLNSTRTFVFNNDNTKQKDNTNKLEKSNFDEINYLNKIIKIKEETLRSIESFQLQTNINFKKNIEKLSLKFKYIPGMRPTPMLAVNDEPNSQIYSNTYKLMIKSFMNTNHDYNYSADFKHLWNHGAYIIFDEKSLEVISFLFTDFSLFIFLLRYINKELWFSIPKALRNTFEKESKSFVDEFSLINN